MIFQKEANLIKRLGRIKFMKKRIQFKNGLVGELNDQPDLEFRNFIHERIKSFNDSISAHHREARKGGVQPLLIQVSNSNGKFVGGLIADTYWGWLDIDDFWIDERYRGKGLGKEMLETAEKEALIRDCRYAQLKTFSFQAREFYEKNDYIIVGELRDYPPGQSFFWMRKDLI